MLLVGDTQQLPPVLFTPGIGEFNYGQSLMKRFEICGVKGHLLVEQYRMDPEIRKWPSAKFYDGKLVDGIPNRSNPTIKPDHPILCNPYFFVDLSTSSEKSYADCHKIVNEQEAFLIVDTLRYLVSTLSIKPGKISVISFYAGQVLLFQQLLHHYRLSAIQVQTVDSFQGDENDVIIISFVRANKGGEIGFLKDGRRLNVAITRAKHMLMLFGNVRTLTEMNLWSKI